MSDLADATLATSMRGLRFGLALLFCLLSAAASLPIASANPVEATDEYVLDVPIVLVLLNFPLNGLVLLFMYSMAVDRSKAWRPSSMRGFIVDMSIVVLLFSSIGALIDLLVFGSLYGDSLFLIGFPCGLIAVFGSALFVCLRYLGMTHDMAATTGALVLLMNFVSWAGMTTDAVTFLYVCVPAIVVLLVVFEVMLVRRAMRFGPGAPRPTTAPVHPPPAYGQAPEELRVVPPTSGMDDKLRTEAISGCIAVLFLLVVLSLYGFNSALGI